MNKLFILSILIIMCLPVILSASEAGVVFLLIEPGSRPNGMGGAYVAQVDDAFAGYWNTGAMAFNDKTQFAGMHSNWFGDVDGIDDMYYEFLAWNQYLEDIGNVGFNITYLTYGEQTSYDENGVEGSQFTSYELATSVTYGYKVNENVGIGTAFKFILSDLAPEKANSTTSDTKGRGMSFAFDFGLKTKGVDFGQVAVSPYNGVLALYNGVVALADGTPADYSDFSVPVDNLDFGLNLQNVGPTISYINDDQADPLPMNLRMGLSYRAIESDNNKITINGDINRDLATRGAFFDQFKTEHTYDENGQQTGTSYSFTDQLIYNIGAEYTYMNLLSLRAGYIRDKVGSIEGPSFGAGIQYSISDLYKLTMDFAMQEGGELTDYNKTFSLGVEF